MKIILASASPRRQQLIQLTGIPVEIIVADVDETIIQSADPGQRVTQIARLKAIAVAQQQTEPAIIIASDTMVSFNNQLLGKASSRKDAAQTLRQFRGKKNQVYTSILLLNTVTNEEISDVAISEILMRPYSDAEIEQYLDSGDYKDKAGSYAIQHSFQPAASFFGCYANILGFPICHLTKLLAHFSIFPTQNVPEQCQIVHQFDCLVYPEILTGV